MNTEVGLDVLRTLHERRLAGTLDRKLPYPEAWVANGLAYLRAKHPFDEDSAIVSRIDREKNYKSRTPQTNTDQSLRSVSQFERLRQHNTEKLKKARLEAEEKQKFEAPSPIRVQKVELRDSKSSVPTNEPVRLRPEPEWVQRYREKATNHDASIIFKLGTWSRLLPSAVFTISVVSLSIWFAQNYKAPTRKTRIWPDIPSAAATMITITGINVAVFLLWRIPQFWSTMNRICLVTPVYPYAVSMLGAPLSHQHSVHLLGNMFFLWFAGTSLHNDIGRGPFLALFFSSAVISAYVPMVVCVLMKNWTFSGLGISGVLTAFLGTTCVLHEGLEIKLPVLPAEWTRGINTAAVLAVLVLIELYSLRKWGIRPESAIPGGGVMTDHMGHLTGYATGIAVGGYMRSTDPKWRNVERRRFWQRREP